MAQRLSFDERARVEAMSAAGVSVATAARCLGRYRSTVHRELRRGRRGGAYDAEAAQAAAAVGAARPKTPVLAADPELAASVRELLKEGWSPHAICAGLRDEGRTVSADCSDIDNKDYVKRLVEQYRIATSVIWALLGPGVLGLALGLAYVSGATVEWVILFGAWYVLSYVLALGAACGHLLLETLRAWNWRRLENQAQGDWKGGTDECLIVGGLLRRGPSLQPKQWAQHCAQALPQ